MGQPLLARALRRTRLYDLVRRLRQHRELQNWERRGRELTARRPTPPPGFKQAVVREYAERFSLEVLVETGTGFGDMVFAARNAFAEIYSIELDRRLYERASRRFRHRRHVHLLPGDSHQVLPSVLAKLAGQPALFWLDAHMMVGGVRGEFVTPIVKELEQILESDAGDSVILVDDARLFIGGHYPTLDQVRRLVAAKRPDWTMAIGLDVIRLHRRPS